MASSPPPTAVAAVAAPLEDYHTVDDEAYTPTYAEAFPPLRTSASVEQGAGDQVKSEPASNPLYSQWASKMSVRSSMTTQVSLTFTGYIRCLTYVPDQVW